MLIFPEIHEVVLTFVMLSVLSPGIQPEFGNDPFHYKSSTQHVTFDKPFQVMRSTQRFSGLLLSLRRYTADSSQQHFIFPLTDTIMMILLRKCDAIFVIKPFFQFRHRFKKPEGQDGLNTQECFINHMPRLRVRNYCCAVLSVILVA